MRVAAFRKKTPVHVTLLSDGTLDTAFWQGDRQLSGGKKRGKTVVILKVPLLLKQLYIDV